jgi:deoxyribonucleoside regulator
VSKAPAQDRLDFLVDVAKLYYEQGRSQQQIARRFRVSRSLVSGLLKLCRQQGIVEIRIHDSRSGTARLQGLLRERYGLTQAVVAAPGTDARAEVGFAAARLLEPMLADNLRIGISWGTTLHALVTRVRPAALKGVLVAQLHGGLGAGDPEIDGFGLAQKLAELLSGSYVTIPAPIVVRSAKLRDLLAQEPGIRDALAEGARSRIALFGIGSNLPAVSSLVRSGILSRKESQGLVDNGVVGTVCGLHIDADGSVAPTPFNHRLVGLDEAAISRIPVRIGVAAGAEKAAAVRAALLGRFVTVLVVDEAIAEQLARG